MDTNAWGKIGWDTIYWAATVSDDESKKRTMFSRFLQLTAELLPCVHCRISFRLFLNEEQEDSQFSNIANLQRVYKLHEKVNLKLRKQEAEKLKTCFKAFTEKLAHDAESFWTHYRQAAHHICNQRDSPSYTKVEKEVQKTAWYWDKTETWPEFVFQFLYFVAVGLILNEEEPSFQKKNDWFQEYIDLLYQFKGLQSYTHRSDINVPFRESLHYQLIPFAQIYVLHCAEQEETWTVLSKDIRRNNKLENQEDAMLECQELLSLPRLTPLPTLSDQFEDVMQHKAGCSSSLQTCRKQLIEYAKS